MRGKAEVHTIDVFTEIVGVLYEVPTDPPEGDLATDVVGKSVLGVARLLRFSVWYGDDLIVSS